jgi:hypothetical protein
MKAFKIIMTNFICSLKDKLEMGDWLKNYESHPKEKREYELRGT